MPIILMMIIKGVSEGSGRHESVGGERKKKKGKKLMFDEIF